MTTIELSPTIVKLFDTVPPLGCRQDFHLWKPVVLDILKNVKGLYVAPISGGHGTIAEATTLSSLLRGTLKEPFLSTILSLGTFTAQVIWDRAHEAFCIVSPATQLDALESLIKWRYTGNYDTDASNLRFVVSACETAFANKSLSFADFGTLLAHMHLPDALLHLKTSAALSRDELFLKLKQSAPVSSAKAYSINATNSGDICQHKRLRSSCFTCSPESRPTCNTCKDLGLPRYRHFPGSAFCKKNQASKGSPTVRRVVVDSGATQSIVTNKDQLSTYLPSSTPIRLADQSIVSSSAVGTLSLPSVSLPDTLVCESLHDSLLSVSQLADAGLDVLFTKTGVYFGHSTSFQTSFSGTRDGPTYYLDPPTVRSAATLEEWHKRFNHLNHRAIIELLTHHRVSGLELSDHRPTTCHSCLIGKGKRGTLPPSSTTTTSPYQVVWFDLVEIRSPSGPNLEKYILTLVDDYSGTAHTYSLSSKAEVSSSIQDFDRTIYNQHGKHVQFLRSDNALENQDSSLLSYCALHGIIQQFTVPYRSLQNKVERFNYTLLNAVRTMLADSSLPWVYWPLAVNCFTYSFNRSASRGQKTPYELLHKRVPNVNHLRTFGSACYKVTELKDRQATGSTKLAPRGEPCRFLGYAKQQKAYLLLNSSGKIISSTYNDCVFPKAQSGSPPPTTLAHSPLPNFTDSNLVTPMSVSQPPPVSATPPVPKLETATIESSSPHPPSHSDSSTSFYTAITDNSSSPTSPSSSGTETPHTALDNALDIYPVLTPVPDQPGRYLDPNLGVIEVQSRDIPAPRDITAPPANPSRRSARFDYSDAFRADSDLDVFVALSTSNHYMIHLAVPNARRADSDITPSSYKEAVTSPLANEWHRATETEINQLRELGTWELTKLPPG